MRAQLAARAAIVALLAAPFAAVFACTDLFHSTADFKNACDVDAANPACNSICIKDSAAARAAAMNACAWLGACKLPIGNNQFGACVFEGILAYDCNANPNRTVQGQARAVWDCMSTVASCDDVARCVGSEVCPASSVAFSGCSQSTPTLRYTCPLDAAVGNENCAAWGQTCVNGQCSATGGVACTSSPVPACEADFRTLHACTDAGVTLVVDCDDFGGRACVAGSTASACLGDHAGQCNPNSTVTCAGDKATGCPSGVSETVDCSLVTGHGTCQTAATPTPVLGVAAACGSAAAPCAPDACTGTKLTSCYRGATFEYDCSSIGGASCALVSTPDGPRAACTH
jgi:hypothetical protein